MQEYLSCKRSHLMQEVLSSGARGSVMQEVLSMQGYLSSDARYLPIQGPQE